MKAQPKLKHKRKTRRNRTPRLISRIRSLRVDVTELIRGLEFIRRFADVAESHHSGGKPDHAQAFAALRHIWRRANNLLNEVESDK
jgi:hypothetical protein